MQMSKRILVTGSSGFIGLHLVSRLQANGFTVICADKVDGIDLCDQQIVASLPDVDVVFHAAALNGTKHFYTNPYDVIKNSVLPTQYLLDRYAGRCEHFIFTGTCESYAGAVETFGYAVPTDEKVPLVINDIMNPRWSYGGSKIASELMCTAAFAQFAQPFTIIRYHNIYGPGQVDHFIPEFVQRLRTGSLELYGYNNTRSFCYIDDAIDATVGLINLPLNGAINIGSGVETSILHAAEIIMKTMGVSKELILKPAPQGSVLRRSPDITLLKEKINFAPKVDLEQGIALTLKDLI
jgi:UDP-glucose 4-epimerase